MNDEEKLLACWGKTIDDGNLANSYHPVLCHMIDVGNIARAFLHEKASNRWKSILSRNLGLHKEDISNFIPFITALHDIGKISDSFQQGNAIQKDRLIKEGFIFGKPANLSHMLIGNAFIISAWEKIFNFKNSKLKTILAEAYGGHHGFYQMPEEIRKCIRKLENDEPPEWGKLRELAIKKISTYFALKSDVVVDDEINISIAVMTLTGFIILCDWLGSDQKYFQPVRDFPNPEVYIAFSEKQSGKAIEEAGFHQETLSAIPKNIKTIFAGFNQLRPIQTAIDEIPARLLQEPCLTVIEAPTGEGKTETAFALAHKLSEIHGSDEFYFALPTTATSNSMFRRAQEFLTIRLGLGTKVKLVHSQAYLFKDDQQINAMSNGLDEIQEVINEWFNPKKRSLLAPFGVGTVDQVELGALNIKHNMLRMIGLAGKILIIDEVHAYDVYMIQIIERLLVWLSKMGTSVILLSATLPKMRRDQLLTTYCENPAVDKTENMNYPAIWVANKDGFFTLFPKASQEKKEIKLFFKNFEETEWEEKAKWLIQLTGGRGCTCWITNTVDRAQKLFSAIKKIDPDIDCHLIHSRFALEDRLQIENSITSTFGPGERPIDKKSIVIGTQILEQSLDLDFDLMISDLAPIDLILQRAGRLHRHNRTRSQEHQVPILWICVNKDQNEKLILTRDSYVYDEYILRKTWQTINGLKEFHLPDDYRILIETVYNSEEPDENSELLECWKKLKIKENNAITLANEKMIPLPTPRDSFSKFTTTFVFEESEKETRWRIAQTRLGEDSIGVIPIQFLDAVKFVCPGSQQIFRLKDIGKSREDDLKIVKRSMRISHPALVDQIRKIIQDKYFEKSAVLKDYYPITMKDNQFEVNGYNLTINKDLGLVISKKEG